MDIAWNGVSAASGRIQGTSRIASPHRTWGQMGVPGAEEAEPLNSRCGDKFIRRSVRCRSQKESVIIMSSNQRDCPS